MGAFAGVFHLDGRPVRRSEVDHMVGVIPRMQPARPGIEVRGCFGVGHLPHSHVDGEVRHSQPVVDKERDLIVVADARLDNRSELASLLGVADIESTADSALLVKAYRRWEERCVEHLVGSFSFVIWDGRKGRLFGARDHLGILPLCYYLDTKVFVFGSAIQGVLSFPQVPLELNESQLAEALVGPCFETEQTYFSKVQVVPPGHTMLLSNGRFAQRQYWALDCDAQIRVGSEEEHFETFRELLREAVRCRVKGRDPMAVSLSGGLDSSSVAVMAANVLSAGDRKLQAFAGIPLREFDGQPPRGQIYDETPYVKAVQEAAHPVMDVEYVRAEGLDFFSDLERFSWLSCCPIRNPGYYPWFVDIHRRARRAGIGSILTGQMGNWFLSQGRQGCVLELATRGHWLWLWRELKAFSKEGRRSALGLLKSEVLYPLVPASLMHPWYRWRHPDRPSWGADSPIHPQFAKEMQVVRKRRAAGLDPHWRVSRHWRRETARTVLALATEKALINYGQQLGEGVEMLDPTADVRLVEFCHATPSNVFVRDGQNRRLVRRGLEGVLPEMVRNRTVQGIQGVDVCLRMEAMRPEIEGMLSEFDGSPRVRRVLEVPRLRRIFRSWEQRRTAFPFGVFLGQQMVLARAMVIGWFVLWIESGGVGRHCRSANPENREHSPGQETS